MEILDSSQQEIRRAQIGRAGKERWLTSSIPDMCRGFAKVQDRLGVWRNGLEESRKAQSASYRCRDLEQLKMTMTKDIVEGFPWELPSIYTNARRTPSPPLLSRHQRPCTDHVEERNEGRGIVLQWSNLSMRGLQCALGTNNEHIATSSRTFSTSITRITVRSNAST